MSTKDTPMFLSLESRDPARNNEAARVSCELGIPPPPQQKIQPGELRLVYLKMLWSFGTTPVFEKVRASISTTLMFEPDQETSPESSRYQKRLVVKPHMLWMRPLDLVMTPFCLPAWGTLSSPVNVHPSCIFCSKMLLTGQ